MMTTLVVAALCALVLWATTTALQSARASPAMQTQLITHDDAVFDSEETIDEGQTVHVTGSFEENGPFSRRRGQVVNASGVPRFAVAA